MNEHEQIMIIQAVLKAESVFASVCNYSFMNAFRPTAQKLASSKITPFTEAYINILSEATMKILSGRDPVDVLNEYDVILEEMFHGKKV